MKTVKIILLSVVLLTQMVSCSDNTTTTNTVATVGDYTISFEKLDLSFKLNPQYAIRTPYRIARANQLNFLIENKYYLITAKEVGLENDPQVQQRMKYIADQEIIKAHLRESFYQRITLSAAEQKAALKNYSEKRQVSFLHTDTQARADSLHRLLAAGKDFDLLAAQLKTTGPPHISGGEVGQITFGDMEAQMEQAIFDLPAGQSSAVVETPAGFFIFQVTAVQQNTDILAMDLNSRLNYVNRILRNRKMDRQIRDHLRQLSQERQIKVNNRLVDLLLQSLSRATAGNTGQQNPFAANVTNSDLEQVQQDINNLADQTVAQFGDVFLNLGEFLLRIKGMPPLQRPNLSSRNRLIQSMIDLVRDDLLLEDAERQGLSEQENVQNFIVENTDEYLAGELQRRVTSKQFQKENTELWQEYNKTLTEVRKNTSLNISQQNLFYDISNPDSVLAPPPIMLFMRDRYIW